MSCQQEVQLLQDPENSLTPLLCFPSPLPVAALAQGVAQAELREEKKEVPGVPARRVAPIPVICWKYFPRTQRITRLQGMEQDGAAAGSSHREGLQGSAWIFSWKASPVLPQLCQSSAGMLPSSPLPGLAPWDANAALWRCHGTHGVPPYLFPSPPLLSQA